MKQPERMPLDKIYSILPEEAKNDKKLIAFRGGIGVAIGITKGLFQRLEFKGSPYLLEDFRLGLILRGRMHGIINLQEHIMEQGAIIYITPGTIVEPIDVSDDFFLVGVGLSADKFHLAHKGALPELFNGKMRDGRKQIAPSDFDLLYEMFRTTRDLLERKGLDESIVFGLITAITHYYDQLFRDGNDTPPPSHSKDIFNRFLHLVNQHGCQEHQLCFYADRLCITTRYLGTVVQATSGIGAKTWIDRAIIASAKVMLRHTDKQTSQIADELHFPNASFFCKYFKRMTGHTPQQYRNSLNT